MKSLMRRMDCAVVCGSNLATVHFKYNVVLAFCQAGKHI